MSDEKRTELRWRGLSLKDLVEHQDETVASRMVVNMPSGSITAPSKKEMRDQIPLIYRQLDITGCSEPQNNSARIDSMYLRLW